MKRKKSIKTDPKLTEILELADKDIKRIRNIKLSR